MIKLKYKWMSYHYIPYIYTIEDHYDVYGTYHQHNTNYYCNLTQISFQYKIPILFNIP